MVYLKITDRYDMTSSVYRGHKAIMKQTGVTMKTDVVFFCVFFVCVFFFFLGGGGGGEALCPSQQFFSHVGTEPPLPGYYQYFLAFWEVNVSCSRIQHGNPSEDRTPTSRPESDALPLGQRASLKQILRYRRSYYIGQELNQPCISVMYTKR